MFDFVVFVPEFHPKLIGLVGSAEEIYNFARAYRMYYIKTDEEDSEYLDDQSIVMYVLTIYVSSSNMLSAYINYLHGCMLKFPVHRVSYFGIQVVT